MNILVCIKEVPDDSVAVEVNENGADIKDITPVINAFDTYALEMAVRLKEEIGAEVSVLSIGPDSAKNSLKNALAVGADSAYLVECDNYKELDAREITKTLIKAKEEIESEKGAFDLICFGKETTDMESAQVGIYFAKEENMGVITNIIAMENKDYFLARQETEDGYREIETSLPCVVTVTKPDYDPRYPTIKSKMAARRKEIPTLKTKAEESEKTLKVLREFAPKKRESGVKIKEEEVEVAVKKAVEIMIGQKVL